MSENYLKEFKDVLYDINDIEIRTNELKLSSYIDNLKKYASENDKLDAFSKCKLYNESYFEEDDIDNIMHLIRAAELLLLNKEHKAIINKHISDESLKC